MTTFIPALATVLPTAAPLSFSFSASPVPCFTDALHGFLAFCAFPPSPTVSLTHSVQEFKHQLLVTCGSRVEMYEWRGPRAPHQAGGPGPTPGGAAGSSTGTLEKHAFYDLPSLVTSVSVIKDYLLAADVTQGLYFMRYSVRGADWGCAGLQHVARGNPTH